MLSTGFFVQGWRGHLMLSTGFFVQGWSGHLMLSTGFFVQGWRSHLMLSTGFFVQGWRSHLILIASPTKVPVRVSSDLVEHIMLIDIYPRCSVFILGTPSWHIGYPMFAHRVPHLGKTGTLTLSTSQVRCVQIHFLHVKSWGLRPLLILLIVEQF